MSCMSDNLYFKQITEERLFTQRIRSEIMTLIHQFFSSNGFMLVDPPILHEQIPQKKQEIYLPLYKERYSLNSSNALYMGAYAALFGRVYAISPTFRDEQNSVNHLVEFRMLEVEALDMSFAELPAFIENFVLFILNGLASAKFVRENVPLARRIETLSVSFHPRTACYTDFVNEINRISELHLGLGIDPSNIDHEISKYMHEPVFLVDYPRKLASWTAKQKNKSQALALNLLLPDTYGELCEGCERTNDVGLLQYKMNCAGVTCLQWYLNAIGQLSVPRCGFGIGVDRLVRWIAGLPNIQSSMLFPRVKQD